MGPVYGGGCSSIGFILVLFILLVIISRSWLF
nr:dihydroorotate dehydrogenase [Paenibacillus castaneae]